MSEEKSDSAKPTVYVSKDDVAAIERFWAHFKFATSKEYNDAKNAFEHNPTVATQMDYRFHLAKEIFRLKGHSSLIDDLFKNIVQTADKISYNIQFDKDLEEILGQDLTTKTDTNNP